MLDQFSENILSPLDSQNFYTGSVSQKINIVDYIVNENSSADLKKIKMAKRLQAKLENLEDKVYNNISVLNNLITNTRL